MAQYSTSGEDLTSIANAIRTASGENSSLVYPTGFISKIGELSKYNLAGERSTKIWESNDISITLAATSLSTWTPSSSSAVIYDSYQVTSDWLTLDHDNFYMIVFEAYTNLVYTETPSVPHTIENYYIGYYPFGPRPNTFTNFVNKVNNFVTDIGSSNILYSIYYNVDNELVGGNNVYGIYYTNEYPRLRNQTQPQIGCNLYTPVVRASANNNYMHADAFNLLDLNNSNINMKVKLYSASRNIMSVINDEIRNLYDINHNITQGGD